MPNQLLIADRFGSNHDPSEVADVLDGIADRSRDYIAEQLHNAADVVRGLVGKLPARCETCEDFTAGPTHTMCGYCVHKSGPTSVPKDGSGYCHFHTLRKPG